MKITPRKPAATSVGSRSTVKGTAKKAAVKSSGYAGKSGFDGGVKKVGSAIRGGRIGGSVNREVSRDFLGIKRGLRGGDDNGVKSGVATLAQRLGIALPDTSKQTGWAALGALGKVLGHTMLDPEKFNRDDFRGVMRMARATLTGKINDPDPSLRF